MIIIAPLLYVFDAILDLIRYFLLAYVILSWLEAFDIVNRYNKVVYGIHNFLFRILEPILGRIRNFLPDLGGIDLSPIVLIFVIMFFQVFIRQFIPH